MREDRPESAAVSANPAAGATPRRARSRLGARAATHHLEERFAFDHSPRLARADVERLLAEAGAPAQLDLSGADLRGAELGDLNLSGARLDVAWLDGARLEHANLAGANLRLAQLPSAMLGHADLSRALLLDANLEAADLRFALLPDARLDHAQMSGARLEGASLQGAHLEGAHLAHASLDGARLRGAHLDEATLWGARLRHAELEGAHFGGADLSDADLHGAFFAGSALADADLALVRWNVLRAGEELAAAETPLAERAEAYIGAADAYRRLRQACTAQGLYDRAGEIYRREMRMRRKAHGYEALFAIWQSPATRLLAHGLVIALLALAVPLLWLWRAARPAGRPLAPLWARALAVGRALRAAWRGFWLPIVRWVWHVALEVLCGYGERVGRVLVAAAVVIVGMALVYLRLGQLTEANGHTVTSFWHALYFSACSFTSLGYAAFAPNAFGLSKWLGVAECFTGNFLLALFLVTFTRKLTR